MCILAAVPWTTGGTCSISEQPSAASWHPDPFCATLIKLQPPECHGAKPRVGPSPRSAREQRGTDHGQWCTHWGPTTHRPPPVSHATNMRVTVFVNEVASHKTSPRLAFEAVRRRLCVVVDATSIAVRGRRTWREVKRLLAPDDGTRRRATRCLAVPWMYPLRDERSSVGKETGPPVGGP